MSKEPLDELIALYRQSAREAPSARIDMRVLSLAERASRRRLKSHAWPWIGAALAASLMLWLGGYRAMHSPPSALSTPSVGEPSAGKMPSVPIEDGTRAYLLHMDIVPPPSPTAQYLLSQNPPSQ
jgi:hypothetical protein